MDLPTQHLQSTSPSRLDDSALSSYPNRNKLLDSHTHVSLHPIIIARLLNLQIFLHSENHSISVFHKFVRTGPKYWTRLKALWYGRVIAKLFVLIFIPQIDLIKSGSQMLGTNF
jgi:hypothetical protein